MADGSLFKEVSESEGSGPDVKKWVKTHHDGMKADGDDPGEYKSLDDGGEYPAVVVPLVIDYGDGIQGASHPYGRIKGGREYTADPANPMEGAIDTGPSEPASRAWEKEVEGRRVGVISGDVADKVVVPETRPEGVVESDAFLKSVSEPRRTLAYSLKGPFGRFSGRADLVSVSDDGSWVGLLYTPGESEFIPPDDPDHVYDLSAGGATYPVRYTGVCLTLDLGRRFLLFCDAS